MGVDGQCHVLATQPPEMTQYPLYRRLGGPQGCDGLVCKTLPLPGFNPGTAQHLLSPYTNCTIPAHNEMVVLNVSQT
jgi:hypothetical protein